MINVRSPTKLGSMVATIEHQPDPSTSKASSRGKTNDRFPLQFDLSDLETRTVELHTAPDGRRHVLFIQPEMVPIVRPRAYTVERVDPFTWNLTHSPVILDDEWFLGVMGVGADTKAGLTIGGVGEYEWSFLPFGDAEPIGILDDGVLRFTSDGHEVAVYGVLNGTGDRRLDGPYQVWVRNTGRPVIGEAFRTQMTEQLANLRRMRLEGNTLITRDVIERMEAFIDSERPMILGSSSGVVVGEN